MKPERPQCPKCGSKSTWLSQDGPDLWLRCLCGCMKLVHTTLKTLDDMAEDLTDVEPTPMTLPKPGTKLRHTFNALEYLEIATAGEIKLRLHMVGVKFSMTEISSYLTLMRPRKLVDIVVLGKGIPGGSVWEVTDKARSLL